MDRLVYGKKCEFPGSGHKGTGFMGVAGRRGDHLVGGNLGERDRVRGASEHGLGPVCGGPLESAHSDGANVWSIEGETVLFF